MERSPVIEIKNLTFAYGDHPVLENVNMTVMEKDFVAIIGPNGGGKTTLLKLMLGLLKPARGSLRILGESPEKAAPRTGYVPQQLGLNKEFPISVLDVVTMGAMKGGKGRHRLTERQMDSARRALGRVDMWEYRKRRIGDLSGGQQQRIFIARALVSDPRILFLDEPTTGVDTQHQADLYELLKELNQRVTIFVVSHDMTIISTYIKSVACVNRQLVFHDRAEVTGEMLDMAYHCPVDLIAHGIPHRVFHSHEGD